MVAGTRAAHPFGSHFLPRRMALLPDRDHVVAVAVVAVVQPGGRLVFQHGHRVTLARVDSPGSAGTVNTATISACTAPSRSVFTVTPMDTPVARQQPPHGTHPRRFQGADTVQPVTHQRSPCVGRGRRPVVRCGCFDGFAAFPRHELHLGAGQGAEGGDPAHALQTHGPLVGAALHAVGARAAAADPPAVPGAVAVAAVSRWGIIIGRVT